MDRGERGEGRAEAESPVWIPAQRDAGMQGKESIVENVTRIKARNMLLIFTNSIDHD